MDAFSRREFLARIRELEEIVQNQGNTIVNLEKQLQETGEEAQSLVRASMEVRTEDVEQLAYYQKVNTELIEFTEEIAGSRSKFAGRARKLLGL